LGSGALILALAACGGGQDATQAPGQAAAPQGADLAEYCDAVVAVEGVPQLNLSGSRDEQVAATKRFASTTLRPLADHVLAVAPAELTEAYTLQLDALAQAEKTGDLQTPFQTPQVQNAIAKAHAFDMTNCGWAHASVTGVDYAFKGMPSSIEAHGGAIAFDFANATESRQTHQMVIVRKSAGVTEPIEELLTLPPEEARSKVAYVAGLIAGPQGSDYSITKLEPGNYAIVCLLPLNTTGKDTKGTSQTHAAKGMVADFTVE
jgi:hypothetical protein